MTKRGLLGRPEADGHETLEPNGPLPEDHRMTPPRESTLEIVARYWLPHEALVAKSALEAFGVPAWVLDETQIRMRWYLANTLGGVKLAVRAEDAYTAREILSGDHAADLSSIEEAALPPHPSEVCERCGLPSIGAPRRRAAGWWQILGAALALSTLSGPAPRFAKEAVSRCAACGHVSDKRRKRAPEA
ncbi:MAG TPA: hypothetical protein VMR31_05730 [Myxococcota bacterium]|nr:hypothetical protein [Myxococcota bacterium]